MTGCGDRFIDSNCKSLTVVALCAVDQTERGIRVNRKFHTGMLEYARRLTLPVACTLPRMGPEEARASIDLIEVIDDEVPYRVHTVASTDVTSDDMRILDEVVRGSALIYCGPSGRLNRVVADLCSAYGVPYIVTTERTLQTELEIMRASTPYGIRRLWREARIRWEYRRGRRLVSRAAEVHANGYPTYHELAKVNPNRLLFFDSRIYAAEVIPEEKLRDRLASLREGRRGPRLIYSGRYHEMKGALDVVRAGIELLRYRRDFRLDLYGAGPLADRMQHVVRAAGAEGHVLVNGQIPFRPDLIDVTRQCDAFLCCHVQGDPSCTYLETFACGVPIVGYANQMWSPFCREAGGGLVVERGNHAALAEVIAALLANHDHLTTLSFHARDFASRNTMERTWNLRCESMEAVLARKRHGCTAEYRPNG